MSHATPFARQWAGLVAQVRLFGQHAPRATLVEKDGMVASVMPAVPKSSLMNVALTADPAAVPRRLDQLAEHFKQGGARKWGLWVDGEDERAAASARREGMVLDSHPVGMVAQLDELPFDAAPARKPVDLATVGQINDLAYGYPEPKLGPPIAALPASVLAYGAEHAGDIASVAMAFDVDTDTAVWFVATLPRARRNGLAAQILQRLLLDARGRGQRTASLQASQAGRPLYERLGFAAAGTLHLYEQALAPPWS
jgi:GNAT superfamily N-acetyltransferase